MLQNFTWCLSYMLKNLFIILVLIFLLLFTLITQTWKNMPEITNQSTSVALKNKQLGRKICYDNKLTCLFLFSFSLCIHHISLSSCWILGIHAHLWGNRGKGRIKQTKHKLNWSKLNIILRLNRNFKYFLGTRN